MSIRKMNRPLAVEQLEDRSMPSAALPADGRAWATEPGHSSPATTTVVTTPANGSQFGLANGGFERPMLGTGRGAYQYQPSYTRFIRWTFSGASGVTGNDTGLTAGTPDAPAGKQAAFLQGRAGITQQGVRLADGVYSIKFQAAQRPGDRQTIRVLVDGIVVGICTPTGTGYGVYRTTGFVATGGYGFHTIRFEGVRGGETAFIDQVSLQRVGLGFETPRILGDPFRNAIAPGNSPWQFGGQAWVVPATFDYYGYPLPPEGRQAAYLRHEDTISRDFVFGEGTYTVGFLASGGLTVRVLVDGVEVGSFTPPATAGYSGYTTPAFTVAAGIHTIRFEGFDPDFGTYDPRPEGPAGPQSSIDLVQINPAG